MPSGWPAFGGIGPDTRILGGSVFAHNVVLLGVSLSEIL